MKILMALLLFAVPLSAQTPVKLYVFTQTDPSGLVDKAQTTRQTTVSAVQKALEKSKLVQIVPTADEAIVRVEVTKTEEKEETDHLSALNNALNGAHNYDTKKAQYRFATLRTGSYSTELSAHANKSEKPLALAIEKWVKDNAATLAK